MNLDLSQPKRTSAVTKARIDSINLGGLGAKAETELKRLLLDMSGTGNASQSTAQPGTSRRIL